jgi:hypothetical protein
MGPKGALIKKFIKWKELEKFDRAFGRPRRGSWCVSAAFFLDRNLFLDRSSGMALRRSRFADRGKKKGHPERTPKAGVEG